MRSLWAVALLALAGCASTGVRGGYFAREAAGYEGRMAMDAVAQLQRLYAPASTRFALAGEGHSPFATALADALRRQGYAVGDASGQGIAVRTVVDALPDDMYRVTLRIGGEELSRAYAVATDGNTYPASFWARCEAPEHMGVGVVASVRRPPPPDAVQVATAPPVTPEAQSVPAVSPARIAGSADAGQPERPRCAQNR